MLAMGPYFIPTGLITGVNDALAGGVINGVAGTQVARSPGQLGKYYYLSGLEAAKRYGGQTQPIYSGLFQYVQVLSTASASPAQGTLAFWDTLAHAGAYVVTTDSATSDDAMVAGVFINPTAPTKGNFCWIQVAGIATVKYKGTLTNGGTPAINDLLLVDATPANLVDDPTQSTAVLMSNGKLIVGRALSTPSGGALGQIILANNANLIY